MKLFKKRENTSKFILKPQKISKNPKWLIKKFLKFLYGFTEEDNITDWLVETNKKFIRFIIDIIITGICVQISLFVPYVLLSYFTGFYIPLKLIPITIISYGFFWNGWERIHDKLVEGRIKSNMAMPKVKS